MCGICGIYDPKNLRKDKRSLLAAMNHAQKHRGPDDEGIFAEGAAGLGHVRLSILDLSSAGHCPMRRGSLTITYNGEVYNYLELRQELVQKGYTFSTDTDTEVVLAAYDYWKETCLSHFNGMFAFAIYDSRDNSLFLARDRYGVKPLYYTKMPGYFLFASEIKSLLTDQNIERRANGRVIPDYLVNGFVDCTDETFFEGIRKLPASSYLHLSPDGSQTGGKYYEVPYREYYEKDLKPSIYSDFRDLFSDSVGLRLRSDVEVGSCLSGGLDSSSIVCEIADQKRAAGLQDPTLATYSVCYPQKEVDERSYIDAVVEKSGAREHACFPDARSLLQDFDDLIYTQDEPFYSTSMYASYCVMRHAHGCGAKVLLDGQGADELLCGYRKARVYYIRKLLSWHRPAEALREAVLYLPYMRKSNSTFLADLAMLRQFLGKKESKNEVRRMFLQPDYQQADLEHTYGNNENFLLNDFSSIVLPALLRYVDRNSMAFSIEDRLPFLDWRLVDYAMQLPLNSKIHDGWSKYVMRRSLDMPEKVRKRKDKIGFTTPEKAWIGTFADEYKRIFESPSFRAHRFVDPEKITANWDRIVSNEYDIGIFRYICLEKWMEIFDVT